MIGLAFSMTALAEEAEAPVAEAPAAEVPAAKAATTAPALELAFNCGECAPSDAVKAAIKQGYANAQAKAGKALDPWFPPLPNSAG